MRHNPRVSKIIFFAILYLLTSIFIISLIQFHGLTDERTGVICMVDFNAHKPFAYRILMPSIIRFIDILTPGLIKYRISKWMSGMIIDKQKTVYADIPEKIKSIQDENGYRIAIYQVLNLLSLFMFLLSLRFMAKNLIDLSESAYNILPLGMAVVIPVFLDYPNYMYDFLNLFLFTAGLILLYREKWNLYLIILTLAILNKETAILLSVVFVIFYFNKIDRPMFFSLLAIQVGLFVIIKLSLYFIFKDNPGGFVELHLLRNLSYLSKASNYFRFESISTCLLSLSGLNFPVPRGLNLFVIALVALTVFWGWFSKSLFLRKSAIIAIILFVLCLPFGHIEELRDYYEALPIIYLLGVSGLLKMMKSFGIIKP